MSVLSNDGSTWLTKLKRIGELSAGNKEMVFNNIGHILSVTMLRELFYELDWKKAVGIDGVTKEIYGENLQENLEDLLNSIRRGTYKPQPSRQVEIPKENGETRPLAISCLEDKLVQLAVSKILTEIYEPLFLPCSYGFRPNVGCHDALRALHQSTYQYWDGAVVEIDIRKYFNTIPHQELRNILRKKISDKRFLRLIDVLINTPILIGKEKHANTQGCGQGSIASPILANIYMHHVIDEWFESIKQTHIKGDAQLIRYADDMVFVFQSRNQAERFYEVLPKRLEKFGLQLHLDKSSLVPCGHNAIQRLKQAGKHLQTFQFLGFTCYWGKSRRGFWRLKYTSRRDRFTAALKRLRKFLWDNLSAPDTNEILFIVRCTVQGWVNYHAVSDNDRRVGSFIHYSKRILFAWFNRRGRKHPLSWRKFSQILMEMQFPESYKTISMFSKLTK